MVILGIDPGIATIGFGVISYKGNRFKLLENGIISTPAGLDLPDRLEMLYNNLMALFEEFSPDTCAVEELFFNTNVKTAIAVGHGRGVILLAAKKSGVGVSEYTPLQVKQGVVGYGRADKRQVMEMVRILLNLDKAPKSDDAADALAVAICHAHSITSLLNIK